MSHMYNALFPKCTPTADTPLALLLPYLMSHLHWPFFSHPFFPHPFM